MIQITPPPISSQAMADLLCTVMLLCKGTGPRGQKFWAYMCIKPSMAEAFKAARESGPFDLADFGTILESGEGEDAPEDLRNRMEREYGFQHDYEDKLLAAIAANKKLASA